MATYFVISDIHGFYDQMISALENQGFDINNKNHVLISLGDLFDRGPKNLECLRFINNIPENRKVLVKGNHEDLLEKCFETGHLKSHDYYNGVDETVTQISGLDDINKAVKSCKENKELLKYLKSCIDYFETDKYVFVHGWIPCKFTKNKDQFIRKFDKNWREGNWTQARWDCCFDAWSSNILVPNKTIVAGHWHTSYGHSKYHNKGTEWEDEWIRIWNILENSNQIKGTALFDIFRDNGIIAIDACTVYSNQVNCLKLGKQKPLVR